MFKIAILNQEDFDFDKKIESSINDFLAEPNNIYVSHSVTVLSNTEEKNDVPNLINRFILLSIVYKDLKDTNYKLDKVSPKIQRVVKKSFEDSNEVIQSSVETDFDRKIKELQAF
jgi:hypothetical protein